MYNDTHGPWKLVALHLGDDDRPASIVVEGTTTRKRFRLNVAGAAPRTGRGPDRIRPLRWYLAQIDIDVGGWPKIATIQCGKEKVVVESQPEYEVSLLPRSQRWGKPEWLAEDFEPILSDAAVTVHKMRPSPKSEPAAPKPSAAPAFTGQPWENPALSRDERRALWLKAHGG